MRLLRPARPLLASLLVLVAAPPAARADTARPVLDGGRSGALIPLPDPTAGSPLRPGGRTAVRVDRTAVSFALAPNLATASVTAVYQLTNAGLEPEGSDLAFAFVRGEREEDDPAAHAFLELDGAPLRFRTSADAEISPETHAALDGAAGDAGARLGYLLFHVDFPPGRPLTIAVHYTQEATQDRTLAVNTTYRFDYLLAPARRWPAFGPLDVSVRLPPRARFSSPLPFARDADGYRTTLAGPPDGKLGFEVMSLDGLWLGMTQPPGYWALAVAGLTAAAVAVGAASGRRWADTKGWKGAALSLLAAGALAAVSALAVVVLLLATFPPHALGFGYAGVLRGVLLALLAGPVGAGVAAVSGRAARRRRAAQPPARARGADEERGSLPSPAIPGDPE